MAGSVPGGDRGWGGYGAKSRPGDRVAGVSSTPVVLPATLRWAVRLLWVEVAAVAAAVVLLLYQDLVGTAADLANALALTGFVAIGGAALAGLTVALTRRRARARAPAIVLQLLAVMTGYLMVTAGQWWLGLPVGALGVVVTSLLVAPSTSAALE